MTIEVKETKAITIKGSIRLMINGDLELFKSIKLWVYSELPIPDKIKVIERSGDYYKLYTDTKKKGGYYLHRENVLTIEFEVG